MSGVLAGLAALQPFGWGRSLHGYVVLWPQRWSFFTGLDRAEPWAYPVRDGVVTIEPRQASDWSWGLDRGSDLRSTEVWAVASRIPDELWQDCATTGCAPDPARVHRMASPVRQPGLCGLVAVVSSATAVPAAGELPAPPRRRVALTDLTCP